MTPATKSINKRDEFPIRFAGADEQQNVMAEQQNLIINYSGNATTVTDRAGKVRSTTTDAGGRVAQVVGDPVHVRSAGRFAGGESIGAEPAFNYPQVGSRVRSLIRYRPSVIGLST